MKIAMPLEEGQYLLLSAKSFSLPEKLGDVKFPEMERVDAANQVLQLWRVIKSVSPYLSSPSRTLLFGPKEEWTVASQKDQTYTSKDLSLKVDMSLSEDAQAGVLWCCLMACHPLSPKVQPVDIVDSIFIPIAERLGREKELISMISAPKKEDASAIKPSRWGKKS